MKLATAVAADEVIAADAAITTKTTTLFSLNIITTPTPSCLIIK